MITLDGPHMGLNDSRSTNQVRMWNTWDVSRTEKVDHMLDWTSTVAKRAPGGKLKHLVFRCHGGPAYLQCGEGIGRGHTAKFTKLRGLVEKIWFSACLVGFIQRGKNGAPGPASRDGNMFCSEIAKAAQCYVVASTELQVIGVNRVLPYGCLDTFEGLVLSYSPEGVISWSRRYPSTYQKAKGGWAKNPD